MNRIAVIEPLALSGLIGIEDAFAKVPDSTQAQIARRRDVLWGSMIQAGVDQIRFVLEDEVLTTQSPMLRKRFHIPEKADPTWAQVFMAVHSSLEPFWISELDREMHKVQAFLVQALYSLQKRNSLILFSSIPGPNVLAKVPPEIRIPVMALLSQFQPTRLNLTAVKYEVPVVDVARFEEVFLSRLFDDYSTASLQLDNSKAEVRNSLELVQRTAKKLTERNASLLTTKESDLSLLTITSKLIDMILGSLPGKIAEIAVQYAEYARKENMRLVVYDFRPVLYELHLGSTLREPPA